MKRQWSCRFGRYANQWALGPTLIYVGLACVTVVLDFGPFYFQVRSELVE